MHLQLVSEAFSEESTKRPPTKQKYDQSRRKHLTKSEVMTMVKAAESTGRHGDRDSLMILMAYVHGMRASELVAVRWDNIDLRAGTITVIRKKHGNNGTHDLKKEELRALRKLQKEQSSPYVFVGERGPLTERAFFNICQRAGQLAGVQVDANPHALRDGTGFGLVNAGVPLRVIQYYLGHVDIKYTVVYTQLSSVAFKGLTDIL